MIDPLKSQVENREFAPNSTLAKVYPEAAVGGFSRLDGQIEFYTRINALINGDSRVLDYGAGRGEWAIEPMPEMSRRLRTLRGRVREVVGIDVDPVVQGNPALDTCVVMELGKPLPFDDATFDMVIADHVLEHIDKTDTEFVATELIRVLKPGGWLAARTPNKWGMIGVAARLVPNRRHQAVLSRLQPDRKTEDVFPTRYAMNTRRSLRRLFSGHSIYAYGHTSEPTYFGTSPLIWKLAAGVNRATPQPIAPTLMIFIQRRA